MILNSLAVALMCLFPIVPISAGISAASAWQVSSIFGVFVALFLLWFVSKRVKVFRHDPGYSPRLAGTVYGISVFVLLILIVNSIGIFPELGFTLLYGVVLLVLLNCAILFVASALEILDSDDHI